jgi:putative PIN family toxin of toxin-antitoxin system
VRAVLDPNVIISALLSPSGAPARIMTAWLEGGYELVVSPLLLNELERALSYPKLRKRITEAETRELLDLLRREADLRDDPASSPPVRSPDPGDDYLITLAAATQSIIVSGDRHLLGLSEELPVYTAAAFLSLIEEGGG